MGYYLLTTLLLVVPLWAYDAFVVLAPLTFLRPGRSPRRSPGAARETRPEEGDHRSGGTAAGLQHLLNPATVLLVLFGVAGGLLTSVGATNPATGLDELLTKPSPVYLTMVLAYLALGILASHGRGLRRVPYFALMSVVWFVGNFLGAACVGLLPWVPAEVFTVFAGAVALLIAASFVVFRGVWLDDGAEVSLSEKADALAADAGLTKRETEILHLLAEGRSLPYVQERLYISEGTARTHVKHIYSKLGCTASRS